MSITLEQRVEQRDAARHYANQIRSERVQLRHQLHNHELYVSEVLANPPRCVLAMSVGDLLLSGPAPGNREANGLRRNRTRHRAWIAALNMRAALRDVNLFLLVELLDDRQRAWLVAELRRMYRLGLTAADWDVLEAPPTFQRTGLS